MESNTAGADTGKSLKDIDLFKSLDDTALAEVARLITWRIYPKGAEIIPHMGQGDDVFFIASGTVRVTIFSFSGKEISYEELGPGSMFGELAAIDRKPRTANVITLEESRIGRLSASNYWSLLGQYPEVAAAAMMRLAGLVRFLIDRVYQYGALDVKDRIRLEVLRLASENLYGDDSARIPGFPTHKDIASRVNTHREAVTRELNDLSRAGLIEQQGRELVIPSVNEIQNLLPEFL